MKRWNAEAHISGVILLVQTRFETKNEIADEGIQTILSFGVKPEKHPLEALQLRQLVWMRKV